MFQHVENLQSLFGGKRGIFYISIIISIVFTCFFIWGGDSMFRQKALTEYQAQGGSGLSILAIGFPLLFLLGHKL